jgi:uncharacterized protein YcnI
MAETNHGDGMKLRLVATAALAILWTTVAQAHVKVRPVESKPGAEETYTVVVPTEGKVSTTSVELEAPKDVVIVSVEGSSYALKTTGDHTTITWKIEIPPGEHREFVFVAKNPATASEIAWKAHQHFADGAVSDWVEAPGSKRPGPVTKLTPQ